MQAVQRVFVHGRGPVFAPLKATVGGRGATFDAQAVDRGRALTYNNTIKGSQTTIRARAAQAASGASARRYSLWH